MSLEGDWPTLCETVERDRASIAEGGGARAVERQHAKGRTTARERVAALCDRGAPFDELMGYAGRGLYPEIGDVPAGGVVTGIGRLHGRPWMIVANDATVKAGAFFPITAKKVIRAQTISLENRLPIIYLVDSAGVYLPMQDEVFPDQDDFGRVFYLNARLSALGVPQLSAILGNCVAGGAYLPVMSDALVMTEGSGLYLAGPALVKAAIGQQVDHEALGGATMHAEVSGTVDFKEPDDAAALERLRALAAGYAAPTEAGWARARRASTDAAAGGDLASVVPSAGGSAPYDVRDVLERLLDDGRFEEHKARYGATLVCATGRLGGFPIGVVANQKKTVKARGRLQVGGVIHADAADKAARFVLQCNQQGVPLLFLQDVTGFMVGRDSEEEGIIRRGAKLVNAVSNSVVPKITVILGGSFGAGHYALAGKAYAPRFIFALPSARYAVMGGVQASKTLLDVHLAQRKRQGLDPDEEELAELARALEADYREALDVRYGAARLWVDDVVLPHELRGRLVRALEACALDAEVPPWRVGVLQT
ncbi:acyl-CoA carboxylase subunit beta [soil metagenome]